MRPLAVVARPIIEQLVQLPGPGYGATVDKELMSRSFMSNKSLPPPLPCPPPPAPPEVVPPFSQFSCSAVAVSVVSTQKRFYRAVIHEEPPLPPRVMSLDTATNTASCVCIAEGLMHEGTVEIQPAIFFIADAHDVRNNGRSLRFGFRF